MLSSGLNLGMEVCCVFVSFLDYFVPIIFFLEEFLLDKSLLNKSLESFWFNICTQGPVGLEICFHSNQVVFNLSEILLNIPEDIMIPPFQGYLNLSDINFQLN